MADQQDGDDSRKAAKDIRVDPRGGLQPADPRDATYCQDETDEDAQDRRTDRQDQGVPQADDQEAR
ncbi:MAG: hypothetical protein HIU92_20850 [Proteobacteria bacterium]|nr:hypothetical protein [Pseudomonadota bacterium]